MLRPNFIKPTLRIDFFGKTRFWVGMGLGLLTAFLLFCIFSMLRLGVHYFFYIESAGLALIFPQEQEFYHFIFASASLLVGQQFFFEFTLNRNRSFKQRNIIKKQLLHESRWITWYGLFISFSWIVTLGLLRFNSVFVIFKFYKIGWWVSILFIIWWHFSSWLKFGRFFKYNYWLNSILFFVFTISAIILSQFKPVLYDNIYGINVKNYAHYRLKIDIPIAQPQVSTRLVSKYLVETFFLGDPNKDGIPTLSNSWKQEINIEDLEIALEHFKAKVNERQQHRKIVSLAIDKNIKMKEVYSLINRFRELGQLKFSLASLSEIPDPNIFYNYFNRGILTSIPPRCDETNKVAHYLKQNPDSTVDFLEKIMDENFRCLNLDQLTQLTDDDITIEINDDNSILIEGKKVKSKALFDRIKSIVLEKKEKAFFNFYAYPNSTYEQYFFIQHEFKRALNEIRNDYAKNRFGEEFDFLPKDLQKEIRIIYPIILSELMGEEERFIFDFFKKK